MREKKGFTQQYVAYVLGVSRVAITKWESGAIFP
ncbi:helix-turn-helix domain-containing protein [Selenomonas noxia]